MQTANPSYYATELAVSASGQTIYVGDLQSAGPPSPPNPSVWVSTDAGATFSPFLVGRTVTGLQLSGDEQTLFFTTPLGLFSVATSCSPLPCSNVAALTGISFGSGKEFRGLALVPCRVGQAGPGCVPCARGTFSNVLGAATCAGSCPAGATTANPGQTSAANCFCLANWWTSSASPLACSPCPADGNSTAGASACTCANPWAYWDAPSGTCILPPSSTPTASISVSPSLTASISVTPTLSTTSTASLSASPSLTSTPSLTRTPSASSTASITSTPSQSPSPTSVPDVLLAFSFSIAPSSSSLRPQDVVTSQRVMSAITTGFASLLGVLASQVSVKNVTDIVSRVRARLCVRRAHNAP
jgi:hypothetical protein